MAINRGKQFEQQFIKDWNKSFKDSTCIRLPDQQSGYYGTSQNICDFICYNYPNIFFIECKSHDGNTFPISCLTQYNKLVLLKGLGVISGVVLWYKDHDRVFFVPIDVFTLLIKDNKKSLNIKDIDKYNCIEIPSEKKRIYLECDYTILSTLRE